MGKHTIARFAFLVVVALTVGSPLSGRAAVVPVAPADGEVFQLLPEKQRKVLAGKTRVERQQVLKGLNGLAARNSWRRQCPLVLKWKTTAGEDGPWRIRLAEKSDLSDARELWLEKDWAKKGAKDTSGEQVCSYEVPFANLDLGKTYYWQVWSNVSCPGHDCGFTYPDTCKCGRAKHGNISSVARFVTSAVPPRWIELEGKTKNVRDLGGWKAAGGRRVRTGMVFRGQGLNENSVSGLDRGRIRLTVEDVAYMTGTLGIKTDLDLRGSKDVERRSRRREGGS